MRKGIILAGGTGSRLFPITQVVSKQLLPVYDKPMIYYPLVTLMQAGITDILLICTPVDLPLFKALLHDGSQWGITLQYAEQPEPNGLAEALIIGEVFLDGAPSALILGDNIFYGQALPVLLTAVNLSESAAHVFGYHVSNPQDYGVISFDNNGAAISIDEKPASPMSSYAMTGLYFFDERASTFARHIKPSQRRELEIVDLINVYLNEGSLKVDILAHGAAWLDTGNPDALAEATQFISVIEKRQGLKVNCPEEVAFRLGLIDEHQLIKLAQPLLKSRYGEYLLKLVSTR